MGPTLRASCDACNQAKVKCTKTNPQCARCKKHNIDCIYGISLRAGKRASQVTMPKKVESPPPLPTDWNMDLSASTTPYSPLEMDLCPSMFEYDLPFPLDGGYPNNSGYFTQDDTFPPMPDLSFSDTHNVHPASITTNASTTNPSPVLSDSVLSLGPSCFRTTILTLSTLQQLSESSHTSFDVALVHNKEAVALCMSTLNCQCASDSTIVLLVASLIAKIINIYQRPCGAVSEHFGLSSKQKTNQYPQWKAVEHRKQSHDAKAVTARLTLGAYNVDEGDEERLKTEIVRMELRKVVRTRTPISRSYQCTDVVCSGYRAGKITRYVLPDQLRFRTEGT
jgi:hypothetical protein